MAQFNLIRGIKVSRIASSTVSMPSPADSLKATVHLRVEGTNEVCYIVTHKIREWSLALCKGIRNPAKCCFASESGIKRYRIWNPSIKKNPESTYRNP